MHVKLQRVMCSDEGEEEIVTDVIPRNKNNHCMEPLGWTLAEAQHLLSSLQRPLLQHQGATLSSRAPSAHATVPSGTSPSARSVSKRETERAELLEHRTSSDTRGRQRLLG
jgi:hypothetical protein